MIIQAYFRQYYAERFEIGPDDRSFMVPNEKPPMEVERLHFALSEDGRHFEPLNQNRPVWDRWLRDPFIQRGPDGFWHMLATEGWNGQSAIYARSRDLLAWESRDLPLATGLFSDGVQAQNIWAPEWIYDAATQEYFLFWSSSFEDWGWKKSRIFYSRTRDWKTFTPARALFEPPYSVIDGTLTFHDGTWFLFHKEEEFSPATGERRAIRLAIASTLEGPYLPFKGPLNNGQITPVITEGPSVLCDPQSPGWLLYYDHCMEGEFGLSHSTDLFTWNEVKDARFPPAARHGSFFMVSAEEAARLKSTLC